MVCCSCASTGGCGVLRKLRKPLVAGCSPRSVQSSVYPAISCLLIGCHPVALSDLALPSPCFFMACNTIGNLRKEIVQVCGVTRLAPLVILLESRFLPAAISSLPRPRAQRPRVKETQCHQELLPYFNEIVCAQGRLSRVMATTKTFLWNHAKSDSPQRM